MAIGRLLDGSCREQFCREQAAMTDIERIIGRLRESDLVRIHPPAGQPVFPEGIEAPNELTEFYSLCGGVDFLHAKSRSYAEYRVLPPAEVVDIGTATCLEAATELPLSCWFAVGEDDNGEHAAIDLHRSRLGQCYDVFHESFWDPASATIIAATFAEFLEKLFARGKSYWFDDGFEGRFFEDAPMRGTD